MNRGSAFFFIFLLFFLAVAISTPAFSEKTAREKDRLPARVAQSASTIMATERSQISSIEAGGAAIMPSFERTAEGQPSSIGADKVLIADIRSGDVLYAAGESERWPLASLAKLMTALLAVRNMDSAFPLTMISEDFLGEGDSAKSLKIGGTYTAEDLLWALLVGSSNEAAEAIARTHGRNRFIAEMNVVARAWGLYNTHFDDPSGISAATQSTAADVKKLVTLIYYEKPKIFEMTQKPSRSITELSSKKTVLVRSTDKFAGQPAFLGGKTGYTDEAGGNLLTIFSYARRPILFVVFGTSDRFGDTERLFAWFKEAFAPTKRP